VTVCSIDSRDKIKSSDYGLILLDEADTYLGSDERRTWVGNLSLEYLYALTGTIKVNHVEDKVFPIYYGKTTRLELIHETPIYRQVYSEFEYYLDDIKDFHELKEAMYTGEKRNKLIVDTVMANISGRKGIVFCEYIEHARHIASELESKGLKVFLLI